MPTAAEYSGPVLHERLEALTENFASHVEHSTLRANTLDSRLEEIAGVARKSQETLVAIETQQRTFISLFKIGMTGAGLVVAMGGVVIALLNLMK